MESPKSKQAVALKYNQDQDMAPIVIASGYGEVAERIIDIATLTGAIIVSLGSEMAGLFSNDDCLSELLTISFKVVPSATNAWESLAPSINNNKSFSLQTWYNSSSSFFL